MNGTILVGVDGSGPSREAVRWAARRCAGTGSALQIVAVLDDEWGTVGVDMLAELELSAHRLVELEAEVARSLAPTTHVHVRVIHGNPIYELAAASLDAELVVVGTHKTGFIRGRVFGSKSLQLAASAVCPVAIIPESSRRIRSGVVVGVTDGPAGDAAVAFAAVEAQHARTELVLLRSHETSRVPSFDLVGAANVRAAIDDERALTDPILTAARNRALELGDGVVVRSRELNGRAAEALVKAGESARLLVIGASRRAGAEQYTLGHVGHDVLLNITGPTIVVHADRD